MDWLKHQLFGEEKLKYRTVTAIRSCRRSGRGARISFGAMICASGRWCAIRVTDF